MNPRAVAFLPLVCTLLLLTVPAGVYLQAQQMPDPKQIAGIPLPVGDVPTGTVVVRVIRGSLANNISDQAVELQGAGQPNVVKTDATGRALFQNLTPGTRVTAAAKVGDEQLRSQEFAVPSSGGIRVMLVATDPESEKRAEEDRKLAAGPAQSGIVVLGEQTRFVFELGDASLSVFNILQIVNTARVPVQPPQPLVFDLPADAEGASLLQNSSPQAKVEGRKATVAGPFAPGTTLVQFAYSMPYSGATLTIAQPMPVSLERVILLVQKSGDMRVASPQLSEQREMPAEGQLYIVGQGPALKAGDVLAFSFSNLPHEPLWPRYLALSLAVAILAAGGFAAFRARTPAADKARNRLETRRSQLFAELAAIEEQHRNDRIDPERYAARRRELVAALERIYAEIDRAA